MFWPEDPGRCNFPEGCLLTALAALRELFRAVDFAASFRFCVDMANSLEEVSAGPAQSQALLHAKVHAITFKHHALQATKSVDFAC